MSIISFLVLLLIVAIIIYGVRLAMAGNWQQLIMLAVGTILGLWVLSALGVSVPSLPTLR